MSRICSSFIEQGGTVTVCVTGKRVRSDLRQVGVDVPCELSFINKNRQLIKRLKRRIGEYL